MACGLNNESGEFPPAEKGLGGTYINTVDTLT